MLETSIVGESNPAKESGKQHQLPTGSPYYTSPRRNRKILGSGDDDVISRYGTISGPEAFLGIRLTCYLGSQPAASRTGPGSTVVTSASDITGGWLTLRRKPRPLQQTLKPCIRGLAAATSSETMSQEAAHIRGTQRRRRPTESCGGWKARKSLKPAVSPKPSRHPEETQADPQHQLRVPLPGPDGAEAAQSPESLHPVAAPCQTSPLLHCRSLHRLAGRAGGGGGRGEEERGRGERENKRHKEQEEERKRAEEESQRELEKKPSRKEGAAEEVESQAEGGEQEEEVQHRLEETSASLAAALQAVEHKIKEEDAQNDSLSSKKTTVSILDDIGSMFDDLADQLDAMLD
ncbi:caskin-1-like protein [Lates japonicus]|uniref:Caskin-1-like protein n=1 Tax=Lates japonicus TaxID=270547 RepID=A0AAD3ME48_LATJO|nr:caskin-1-like protein [Lates japonicus]